MKTTLQTIRYNYCLQVHDVYAPLLRQLHFDWTPFSRLTRQAPPYSVLCSFMLHRPKSASYLPYLNSVNLLHTPLPNVNQNCIEAKSRKVISYNLSVDRDQTGENSCPTVPASVKSRGLSMTKHEGFQWQKKYIQSKQRSNLRRSRVHT